MSPLWETLTESVSTKISVFHVIFSNFTLILNISKCFSSFSNNSKKYRKHPFCHFHRQIPLGSISRWWRETPIFTPTPMFVQMTKNTYSDTLLMHTKTCNLEVCGIKIIVKTCKNRHVLHEIAKMSKTSKTAKTATFYKFLSLKNSKNSLKTV